MKRKERKRSTFESRTVAKSFTLIVAVCVAMCVLSSPALGATFNPTDDSYCKEGVPSDNFGTRTYLELRDDASSVYGRETYLKFVVSGISGTVTTAKLRLYSDNQSGSVSVKEVSDTSWTESTITWNNRPSMGSTVDTQTMSSNSWSEFDVISYITGNGTYSIGVTTSVNALGELSSKEGSNDPVLEVTTGGGGDTTPPANPTGLSATGGVGQISLDWNNNGEGDLDGYNVYRSTTSGSGYSKINGSLVSTSDYTDNSVSSGTTYYYVVTAVDTSSNESGYSNEDSAASTGDAISPWAMVAQMDIGVDCTWSEFDGRIAEYTTQELVDFVAKGFKHYRLRVNKEPASQLWTFLDGQVQDCLDNNAIPIIANQSHTFEDDPTQQNQANWVQWWEDVADHYKAYSHELMFDLIIECAATSSLSTAPINQLNEAYDQAVTAIRNTGGNNATRIIIMAPPKRSDPTRFDELDIPTDGNGYLMGEFHEGYASGPDHTPPLDAADKLEITSRFDAAVDWSDTNNIPVWEGAWMPGDYNKGDTYSIAEQQEFAEFFVSELKARDIPNSVNTSHQFYDAATNEWNFREPVVDTIMSTWYGTSDTTPPANPTGLAATAGDAQVALDWNNNTEGNLDGYNVYRSTTTGSGFSKINGSLVSASAYTDSSVSNDTTYYYVVSAVDTSSNESGYSNEDWALPESVPDTTPPANPTGLVATGGDSQVSLDWNNNGEGDLDGYNVYRSTTTGSGYSKINGSLVSASEYTDSTVSNDTTYYYVVTAVDTSSNESGYSNEDSAVPAGAPDIYVYDITMGGYESKTNYYCATATVWIKDTSLNNINGATVFGTWSGATKKGDEEKTTETDGKAILTSSAVKGGGTFTFTVTNVTATGYNYNSSLNNEDYDSITVP